jgi:hypothetical protein
MGGKYAFVFSWWVGRGRLVGFSLLPRMERMELHSIHFLWHFGPPTPRSSSFRPALQRLLCGSHLSFIRLYPLHYAAFRSMRMAVSMSMSVI